MGGRTLRRIGGVAGLLVGLTAAVVGAAGPVQAATASTPPLPPGARPQAVTPFVYPGGGAQPYGDAQTYAAIPPLPSGLWLNSVAVGMALTKTGRGYWIAAADGGVFSLGDAPFYGSLGNLTLNGPVVGFAPTPDNGGYWMVALDGGVFAFGDAQFYGSMGGRPLNEPVLGMAVTPSGHGYWLVASDGGIFAFGDAQFYGSMGGQPLNAAVSGIASTPSGHGYWMVAGDGGIFSFGDAQFYGSTGNQSLSAGITGMSTTSDGRGYWLVGWNGSVFPFGDARYFGSPPQPNGAATPYVQLVPTPDNGGYWLFSPDQLNYSYTNPPPNGTFPGSSSIVAAAQSQVQPDPDTGYFCNPYGPCEAWCALFATWAAEQGGSSIPIYAFTGDIYYWGAARGRALAPWATPVPGDIVLYGTGPWTVDTSVHTGIVAQVWPDGAIVTIEGDAGPGVGGHLAVVTNGPFLPADSPWYNGMPIYAYVEP